MFCWLRECSGNLELVSILTQEDTDA